MLKFGSIHALIFYQFIYFPCVHYHRAIIVKGKDHIAMSTDFTPILERRRLQHIAEIHPQLLSDEFTHLEFQKRVQRKDLGKKLLYRDGNMVGW